MLAQPAVVLVLVGALAPAAVGVVAGLLRAGAGPRRPRLLLRRLLLGWHHLRLWAVDIFADPARQEAQVARAVREAIGDQEQS